MFIASGDADIPEAAESVPTEKYDDISNFVNPDDSVPLNPDHVEPETPPSGDTQSQVDGQVCGSTSSFECAREVPNYEDVHINQPDVNDDSYGSSRRKLPRQQESWINPSYIVKCQGPIAMNTTSYNAKTSCKYGPNASYHRNEEKFEPYVSKNVEDRPY